MENDFYVDAINSLLPGAKFHAKSGYKLASDNSIIEWYDERTEPTVSAIQTEMTQLEAEYDAQEYARNRELEYPTILDYIDGVVKDDQTQIDKYIEDCKAVKTKYPKPE